MNTLINANIHFVGICGSSMSALAMFALNRGAVVSGSDRSPSVISDELSAIGVRMLVYGNPANVENAKIVVFSSAVPADNPEILRARELGIAVYERHEFLGLLTKPYRTVAVAGTHGKTTVAAMLSHILVQSGANFVGHVGGETEYGNLVDREKGENAVFLTEACEYKRSLLSLSPQIGIVLNAECDHPDCYRNIDEVKDVFRDFLRKCEIKIFSDPDLICSNEHLYTSEYEKCAEGKETELQVDGVKVLSNSKCDIFAYAHIRAKSGEVCGKIEVFKNGKSQGTVLLPLLGEHNARNCLFAVAAAEAMGMSFAETAAALTAFKGVKRRFERAGKLGTAEVIFDYAHHPSEIEAVLEAVKDFGKTTVIFQPHTYSRTERYMSDFVRVLSPVRDLIMLPTYAAREYDGRGANSAELTAQILHENAKSCVKLTKYDSEVLDMLNERKNSVDLFLFLGAGDIYKFKELIKPLK